MGLLILTIFANVLLAIIFKLYPKYNVHQLEAIIVNYFTCYVISCIMLERLTLGPELLTKPWIGYALCLGFIFIVAFNLTAFSIQKVGIIITGLFQKMSLIFPVAVAIAFYGEAATTLKISGIIIAIIAIVLINTRTKNTSVEYDQKWLILPLILFIAAGVIEVLFYVANKNGIIGADTKEFTGILFFIAGALGLPVALIRNKPDKLKSIVAGIILGIPNFFSIYLLLKLLDNGWDGSVVFPLNNVSILTLTALIGYLAFAEKMNVFKIIGFILACVSIVLIAI